MGFSIDDNAKIQSQRFFDKTKLFLEKEVEDPEERSNLLSVLKLEYTTNQEPTINPKEFAATYMEDDLYDRYQDVVHELPQSFVKDQSLLKSKLSTAKIIFPNKVVISGPETTFGDQIKMIATREDLLELDPAR